MKISDLITNRLAKSDPLTLAIVRHYEDCEIKSDEWGEGTYELITSADSLMICGDDSWGAVTGVLTFDGHLVVVANYGDEGEILFSPSLNRGEYSNSHAAETRWVNGLNASDIIIARQFNVHP